MFQPPQAAFKLPNIKHRIARIGGCNEIQRRAKRTLKTLKTFRQVFLSILDPFEEIEDRARFLFLSFHPPLSPLPVGGTGSKIERAILTMLVKK